MATVALSQTPATLEVKRLPANRVQIQVKGSPGSLHALQFSDELGNPIPWGTVTNIALGTDGSLTLETSTQASVRRYYRALADEGFTAPTNFVFIPPGTFMMGSPETEQERDTDETQHQVTLTQGFWMGQHEVTQGEYLSVMGSNPSYFKNGVDASSLGTGGRVTNDVRHPVDQVSWIDATNYCGRLTQRDRAAGLIPADYAYRLPTEAEWEYACRAGSTNAFSFGTAIRQGMANFDTRYEYESSVGAQNKAATGLIYRTVEVGSYPANAFGLYDMHGNVWEWCSDYYGDYPAGNATDPKGQSSGIDRVIRGGSWDWDGRFCRAAIRNLYNPTDWVHYLGFRVVLAPVR